MDKKVKNVGEVGIGLFNVQLLGYVEDILDGLEKQFVSYFDVIFRRLRIQRALDDLDEIDRVVNACNLLKDRDDDDEE